MRPFLAPVFAVGVHLDKRSVTWQPSVLPARLHPEQSGLETWRERFPKQSTGGRKNSGVPLGFNIIKDQGKSKGKLRSTCESAKVRR